jgi:hypothetical protein
MNDQHFLSEEPVGLIVVNLGVCAIYYWVCLGVGACLEWKLDGGNSMAETLGA